MMWWSNGSNLVDNRIKCSPGQILSYIPAALPTKPQRPLAQPQVN